MGGGELKQTWQGDGWSACGKKGLGVRPKKGDALLFWSLKPNGLLDTYSKHAGCPVIRGTKWTATKWMHVGPYSFGYGGKKVRTHSRMSGGLQRSRDIRGPCTQGFMRVVRGINAQGPPGKLQRVA